MGQKKDETVTNIYFPFDIKKVCDPRSKDEWTRGRLIDECYLCLDRVEYLDEEEDCLQWKYNEQANYLMYRISGANRLGGNSLLDTVVFWKNCW